jgi:hypothetical protein
MEIESDLYEQLQAMGSQGVLGRCLRGIPADVWWRIRTMRERTGVEVHRTGGIAVSTTFTKSAGVFALMSAAAWFIALAAFWVASLFDDRPSSVDPNQFVLDGQTVAYMLAVLTLIAAGALMVVAMVGLYQRHRSLGTLGMLGLGITGLGVAASVIAWFWALWITLIGLGVLIFAIAMLRRDIAPRLWTVVWGAGLALGAIIWGVLRWLEVGTPDQWGDYGVANATGAALGVLILAVGLIGLGRWLAREEPADIEPTAPLTPA